MKRRMANAGNAYHIYRNRRLILPMVGDVLKGRYRFSAFTLLVIILGILYVLFPFDLLPDFIPLIGWIDDGIWLYLLLQQLKKETIRYQQWRAVRLDPFHPDLFLKHGKSPLSIKPGR